MLVKTKKKQNARKMNAKVHFNQPATKRRLKVDLQYYRHLILININLPYYLPNLL